MDGNYCRFQLEMKKMLLDRMVNLLTRGCVVPVVKYIKQCCLKGDTDVSLIRYFVTEVSSVSFKLKMNNLVLPKRTIV